MDTNGKIFYIGKGMRSRAWSRDNRHSLWYHYVEKHLGGDFQVRILQDNLSPEEAEELEADWMAQCSPGLVNWVNPGRDTDLDALERYNQLRDANRSLIQQAKAIEKDDLEQATVRYMQAIDAIAGYRSIRYEKGFLGQLMAEQDAGFEPSGEIEALNRLTMCLIKLGRPEEAAQRAQSYFALYKGDLHRAAAKRIFGRVEKALARQRKKIQSAEPAE